MEVACASVLLLVLPVLCQGQNLLGYSIIEGSEIGTVIGNVGEDSNLRATVSEEDFAQIDYSFLTQGKSYEDYFGVDEQLGSIYTTVRIDRENITDCLYTTNCVLPLSVVAKSKVSAFFRTLKVNITVIDINDNAPTFPKQSTSLSIFELATVGSSISIVGAVDSDAGNNTLQRYYIKDGSNNAVPFTTSYDTYVDGSSVVKLVLTGDLDRETQDFYSLTIVAEDGGNPKLTGTITVDIEIEDANDNSPEFQQQEYNATINETTPIGTEILTLTAVDADLGVNSEIVYSLSKNQIGQIHELFAINETSGVLCVKGTFSSGGQYRVIVEASDKGDQPLLSQTVVIVTVVDSDNNPPVMKVNLFTDTEIGVVSEYADIGTVVAHVALIDSDTGVNGLIKCEITSDNNVFGIQGIDVNEYKVTVAKGLDREQFDYIYVIITCYDKGTPPLNTFAEFTVEVQDENDHSPQFLQEVYFIDISENNNRNIDLVQVSAIDGDINKNGEISYSVWADGLYQFYMDPLSGIIKTMSVFDRETDARITLYAYAKDYGSPARTSTATVVINVLDLNDNSPEFENSTYELSAKENEPASTIVRVLRASDNDTDDNARLSFVIDETLPFTIDAHGTLATKEVLNREKTAEYNFTVTVYDHGVPSRNNSCHVTLKVKDVNDHAPQFVFPDVANYTVEMDAETAPNSVIATIKAFDLDEGRNGQLFFSMENTNVSGLFAIDGYTGTITLLRLITLDDQPLYYLMLRVDDNGNPRLFKTTSLNIFVTRKVTAAPEAERKGENLLIAITLATITFILVFTIVLVICILKRRSNQHKDSSDSENRFYDKEKTTKEKRVSFADLSSSSKSQNNSNVSTTTPKTMETMGTQHGDCNVSRDSDMTSSTVDMETPILDKSVETQVKNSAVHLPNMSILPKYDGNPVAMDARHSTPRSDTQLMTLQSHSALLHSTIKPHATFSTFGHDDNHSQTSGETITSDSGRGGSESDIHSSSLSQSHDSDLRQPDFRHPRNPLHSTFNDIPRPWMNLADLQNHRCDKIPIARQLHNDQRNRLQLKDLTDKNKYRNSERIIRRVPCTIDHSQYTARKPEMRSFRNQSVFPLTPPSEHDRSFMTYEEDDDDMSTTTSGSYTIDHEDVTLDLRASGIEIPGLRSCLV